MKLILYSIQIIFIFLTWADFNPANAQTIRYVKTVAEGAGNGTSWENASSNLQEIIDASDINDEIWVAAGTYKPSKYPTGVSCTGCTSAQDYAFILKNGTKLYGGFLGTETDFNLRDPKNNVTVLSGDLNSNGSLRTNHVVLSISDQVSTILDGLTVQGGGNTGSASVTIEATSAPCSAGGGMAIFNSSPTITNCIFKDNINAYSGAGVYISGTSNAAFVKCTFKNNNSPSTGGALYVDTAVPTFTECIFTDNIAATGGAIALNNSSPNFEKSIFTNNSAANGGVVYSSAFSTSGTKYCHPTFKNCIFTQNAASMGGVAYSGAAAMYPNVAYAGISAINSVFSNNSGTSGSVIYNAPFFKASASTSVLLNCVVWGNVNAPFGDGQTNGLNCIVQPNYNLQGETNIVADPLFTNSSDPDGADNIWGTADDGLQLGFCSPAINAGFTTPAIPSNDLLGNAVYNSKKDIGAYERQSPSCEVFIGGADCQSISVNGVKENRWHRFYTTEGLVAEINPGQLDLGTVTVSISDPDDVIDFNNYKFLGRTINVTSSKYASGMNMPETYRIRFYYYDTELAEYNAATSGTYTPASFNMAWKDGGSGCTLDSYDGTNIGLIAKSDITSGDYGVGDYGFYLQYALNHMTIFAPTTAGLNALPVTLTSFTGRNEGLQNVLYWQTTSETNNDHFEVERSENGINFETIGEHLRGAGTTRESNNYSFKDDSYAIGVNYYRLKQVDTDGTFTLSRILAIKNNATIALYPNPVRNEVFLDTQGEKFNYQIVNVAGRMVKKGTSKSKTGISTSDLPAGVYLISYEDQVFRFVKE